MDCINDFEANGYAIIENFLTADEVESLIKECANIVENICPSDHLSIFQTGKDQVGDEYFLDSGDKISFFFEKEALSNEGDLILDKRKALNKIGHALHWWNPVFKRITFSQKVKDLLKQLRYNEPVVVQSMYIFKHPKIGGEVVPHQDSTYLYTTPLSTLGLWFPLVDVSEENGCLWFAPGSHKSSIYQRFVRNPLKDPLLILKGEAAPCSKDEYVPAIVKKGDCVIIHGSVLHKSYKNSSQHSRPVYTFHVVEKRDTSYSPENWLQATKRLPFPSVFRTCCEN